MHPAPDSGPDPVHHEPVQFRKVTIMDKCIYCGSTDLTRNIDMGLNAESSPFGLKYKALMGIRGTEPVYADLCDSCGSITRLHVHKTDHKWSVK